MKSFTLLFLSALLFLSVSCNDYLLDSCLNTTIYFSLKDKANNDVFGAVTDHVALFIYDKDGRMAARVQVPKSELALFAGKRLRLNPGQYTIVAWANPTDSRSAFVVNEHGYYLNREANYLLNAVPANGIIPNGDPLFYAPQNYGTPLRVTVPEVGKGEVTAEFRNAHVRLDISVQGYETSASGSAADPLKIEITDLTSRYDFGMDPHGTKVDYTGSAPFNHAQKLFVTSFNIPVFDKSATTQIRVTNKAGQLIVPPISLVGLLGNKIVPQELWHLPIEIVFTDHDGVLSVAVKVALPEWEEGGVVPNI